MTWTPISEAARRVVEQAAHEAQEAKEIAK